MLKMSSFNISCWNIQGLWSSVFGLKSTDPEFLKNISDAHILVFVETWCREDTVTHCPSGYGEIIVPSIKLKTVRRGRDSGGILVWYKAELKQFITVTKKDQSHIWIKLNKKIANWEKDIYLCAAYSAPHESPYHNEEFFNTLHTEICHFQAQGNVLLCGDFNARTGTEPDCIDPQGNDHVFGNTPLYLTPTTTKRNNPDSTINKNGRELVHLCRALGLYILNGRIRGDSLGRFTYCSALGTSVVDYAVTDMDPSSFSAFTVRQQTPPSDHNQINVFLKRFVHPRNTQPCKLYKLHQSYRWADTSTDEFSKAMRSTELTHSINTFINTPYQNNKEGLNQAAKNIINIFQKTANKANLTFHNKRKLNKSENWFDIECKNVRKTGIIISASTLSCNLNFAYVS